MLRAACCLITPCPPSSMPPRYATPPHFPHAQFLPPNLVFTPALGSRGCARVGTPPPTFCPLSSVSPRPWGAGGGGGWAPPPPTHTHTPITSHYVSLPSDTHTL